MFPLFWLLLEEDVRGIEREREGTLMDAPSPITMMTVALEHIPITMMTVALDHIPIRLLSRA